MAKRTTLFIQLTMLITVIYILIQDENIMAKELRSLLQIPLLIKQNESFFLALPRHFLILQALYKKAK